MITEIAGDAGSGKTTFALSVVANAQRYGLSAVWIDAERVFAPAYAARLGVDLERLPVLRADSAEELLEIARQLAGSYGIDLLALDSAAALTPALELQVGIGAAGPGLQSRVLATGFRHLAHAAAKTETAVLVLNQLRSGGGENAGETTAAGPAVKLRAAVRIVLYPVNTGLGTRFRILKSGLSTQAREGEIRLEIPPEPSASL